MAWVPPDGFEAAVSKVLARAGERANREREQEIRAGMADLARRGLARSGAAISLHEVAAAKAVTEFGRMATADLINLMESVYESVPVGSLGWLRSTVSQRVESLASSLGDMIEDKRQQNDVSIAGAREAVTRASQEILRDLDLEIATIQLRHERQTDMKLPAQAFPDRVKVVKKNGQTFDNVTALVDRGKIMFPDTSVPIEDGDRVTRALPGNAAERYTVVDSGFVKGIMGLSDHYQSVVRKDGADAHLERPISSQTIVYNVIGAQARVNVQSTDSSTNVISVNTETLFSSMREAVAAKSDLQDDVRTLLLARIDAMESEADAPSFASRYAEFMSSAADHLQVFGAFLPALSQLLQKAVG